MNETISSIRRIEKLRWFRLGVFWLFFWVFLPGGSAAEEMAVLFSKGPVTFLSKNPSMTPVNSAIGKIADSHSYSAVQIQKGGVIFFRVKNRCIELGEEGTYFLNEVIKREQSFLCQADLFLSRIASPRLMIDENLPRGDKVEPAIPDDVFFNNIWQTLVQNAESRRYYPVGTLIGTAAYYHKRKNWARVNYLLGLVARTHPVFKDIYLQSWQKTTPKDVEGEISKTKKEIAAQIPYFKNRALLIGIDKYQDADWQTLDNPLKDVDAIRRQLIENYDFKRDNITLLRNPTYLEIIDAFDTHAATTDEKSNLLIYFAGHGYFPSDEKTGYWIPSDAGDMKSKVRFLSNHLVLEKTNAITSKHTLLIADACFSGDLVEKARGYHIYPSRYFTSLSKKPSRQIITAGGLEYVSDRLAGKSHSVFAQEFLSILGSPRKTPLSASELALKLRKNVINTGSNQTPAYGRMANGNDRAGEFFFVHKTQSMSDLGDQVMVGTNQNIKPLAMVFNLDMGSLSAERQNSLNKVFRKMLAETGKLNLIHLAFEGDHDLGVIKKSGRCGAGSCAVTTGNRLGVDEVITGSVHRFEEGVYYLSAEVINTVDGTILAEKTLKHSEGEGRLDQAVKQLANDLVGAGGHLSITSNPTDAVIIMDGLKLKQTSDVEINNVLPGIHVLTLQKDNLWTTQTIYMKAGEAKKLFFNLKPTPVDIQVNSEPPGAEVFIDQEYQGQTPLSIATQPGLHEFQIEREGFQTVQQNFLPKLTQPNELNFKLNKLVNVEISVSPPDSQVEIDNHRINEDALPSPFDRLHMSDTMTVPLLEGNHTIKVTHPGSAVEKRKSVNLNTAETYHFDFMLALKPEYLDLKKYQQDLKQYKRERFIRNISLVLGALGTYYLVDSGRNVLSSQEAKENEESLMLNAGSKQQSLLHYAKAVAYGKEVEKYNSNVQSGALLTSICFGVAVWYWTEEPEKPESLSFHPFSNGSESMTLNYSLKW